MLLWPVSTRAALGMREAPFCVTVFSRVVGASRSGNPGLKVGHAIAGDTSCTTGSRAALQTLESLCASISMSLFLLFLDLAVLGNSAFCATPVVGIVKEAPVDAVPTKVLEEGQLIIGAGLVGHRWLW